MMTSANTSLINTPWVRLNAPVSAAITSRKMTINDTVTFCAMTRLARRASRTVYGSLVRSSDIRATSAVSIATSVPAAPITTATSDEASAGASLTPSPTMTTEPPCVRLSPIAVLLSCGINPARTVSMPTLSAIAVATRSRSPVSISVRSTPSSRSSRTAVAVSGRSSSATPNSPSVLPSSSTATGVAPADSIAASASAVRESASVLSTRPTEIRRPSTVASAPLPATMVVSSAGRTGMSRSRAACTIASAIGCVAAASTAAASLISSSSLSRSSACTLTSAGRPRVSVPVLSKATVRTRDSSSR